jgi:hypothetical protein
MTEIRNPYLLNINQISDLTVNCSVLNKPNIDHNLRPLNLAHFRWRGKALHGCVENWKNTVTSNSNLELWVHTSCNLKHRMIYYNKNRATWHCGNAAEVHSDRPGTGYPDLRTNLELQNVYRSPDIVTEIKVRRLEWLGHIIRMDGARMAKKKRCSSQNPKVDVILEDRNWDSWMTLKMI